tara:strand:+ start:621 stop:788 length:168 start_codon:yes stop_codon:yes gene_type:complete
MWNTKLAAALLGVTLTLGRCSSGQVLDNTVGATGFVAKTALDGTIGADKLAIKGV